MKRRIFLSAAMLSLSLSAFAAAPAVSGDAAADYFVDLLVLQKGKTAEDAAGYFELIEPVVAKHGLERALPSFNITQWMAGEMDVDMLNVWTVSDPANTFDNIFSDSAYTDHIKLRNSIFDMGNSVMFMLSPNS